MGPHDPVGRRPTSRPGRFGDLRTWLSRSWDATRYNVPYWPIMVYNLACWVLVPNRRFFEPDDVPGAAVLAERWPTIRTELDDLLAERETIPGFEEVDPGQRRLTDDRRWRTFVLRMYGADSVTGRARCPATAALIDEVPGLYTAMFSILEPHKRIPLHSGALKGLIRYQLPLLVPVGPGCEIEIGGVTRTWVEGEPLIFDDTYLHRVRNDTDEVRVILFVDLVRPMPWPWLDRLNQWVLDRMTGSVRIRRMVARAEEAAVRAG